MRYLKVLLFVLLFFFVMLFFVQNQTVFSQVTPLNLDLMFIPVMTSAPLPLYTLLLVCFVLGALATMAMLIWDRVRIGTKLSFANMRARGFEKDFNKACKQIESVKEALAATQAKLQEAQTAAKEAAEQVKNAEKQVQDAEKRVQDAEKRVLLAESSAQA